MVIRGKSYCSQEIDCKNEPNALVRVTGVRNGIKCVGYTTNFQDSTTVKCFCVLWGGLTESPQFCQPNVHLQKYCHVNLFCYVLAEHRDYCRLCSQKAEFCIMGLPDLTCVLL